MQNKDEVLLYWFLSWLNNFHKLPEPKPDFERSALSYCERNAKRKIWEGADVSLPKLKQIYKQVLGKEFNEKENPNYLVNPNKIGTPINKIARAQSDLRDSNIASEIERYWNERKSIFVVFGRGHLIIQRKALEAVLK